MKYLFNIFLNIFSLVLFSNIIYAQDNAINILINKPVIEDNGYLEKYNYLMKEYFAKDDFLSKYNINFSFCQPTPEDGQEIIKNYEKGIFISTYFLIDNDYPRNFNCTLRELKNSKYDLMIVDNGFLFSDDSFVKSIFLNNQYSIRRMTDYYVDYNEYKVNSEALKHHDTDILNSGKFRDGKLYGLPYEIDFNLVYNNNNYNASRNSTLEKRKDKDEDYSSTDNSNLNNDKTRSTKAVNSLIRDEDHSSKNVKDTAKDETRPNKNVNDITNEEISPNRNVTSSSKTVKSSSKNNESSKKPVKNSSKTVNSSTSNDDINLNKKLKPTDSTNSTSTYSSVGFKDNDELLDSFAEYVSFHYNIPNENDIKSFDVFYNKTIHELFNAYHADLLKYTGNNIQKSFETSMDQAYTSFINDEYISLNGKASFYKSLSQLKNVTVTMNSLTGDYSVLQKKYLIINGNSKKPKDELAQLALRLTSPEMQLYRSQVLGTIPTFNIKNKDEYSAKYCQEYSQICTLLTSLKPVHINTFFKKNKFSANFMETRLVLPTTIRDGLLKNNDTIIESLFVNLLDNEMVPLTDFNKLILICNGINILILLMLIAVIFLVFKYRKNPYMKAISPYFCILTILGIVMNLSFIYLFMMSSMTVTFCRFSYIYKVIAINLIYLPMIAIIFRIYYIYTNFSKVNYGKNVNNKRLFIYVFSILAVIVGITSIVAFNDDFYIGTFGSLLPLRFDLCVYNNMYLYYNFANVYCIVMVSIYYNILVVNIYIFCIYQ